MPEDFDEHTPAERPLGRREYAVLIERFNNVDRSQAKILARCDESFSMAFRAYQYAKAAVFMRSTWAPYAFALAVAFATALITVACTR